MFSSGKLLVCDLHGRSFSAFYNAGFGVASVALLPIGVSEQGVPKAKRCAGGRKT